MSRLGESQSGGTRLGDVDDPTQNLITLSETTGNKDTLTIIVVGAAEGRFGDTVLGGNFLGEGQEIGFGGTNAQALFETVTSPISLTSRRDGVVVLVEFLNNAKQFSPRKILPPPLVELALGVQTAKEETETMSTSRVLKPLWSPIETVVGHVSSIRTGSLFRAFEAVAAVIDERGVDMREIVGFLGNTQVTLTGSGVVESTLTAVSGRVAVLSVSGTASASVSKTGSRLAGMLSDGTVASVISNVGTVGASLVESGIRQRGPWD